MPGKRGSFLRKVGDLSDRHLTRTVTLDGWTGQLVGLIPLGDKTSLALITGGSRCWTPALPNETPVEVHLREAS